MHTKNHSRIVSYLLPTGFTAEQAASIPCIQ